MSVVDDEVIKMWRDPDGKFHREDGPAVEWADGRIYWYFHGKKHRVDGPAEEWADGSKFWYLHDKLHRVDGPATEWPDGLKTWYLHGKMHRADGPAEEWPNGRKRWFFEGHKITEAQSKFIQRMHQKAFHHKFKLLRYWMIERLYDPKRKSGEKRAAESWDDTRELYAKGQK